MRKDDYDNVMPKDNYETLVVLAEKAGRQDRKFI